MRLFFLNLLLRWRDYRRRDDLLAVQMKRLWQ